MTSIIYSNSFSHYGQSVLFNGLFQLEEFLVKLLLGKKQKKQKQKRKENCCIVLMWNFSVSWLLWSENNFQITCKQKLNKLI